MATNRLTDAVCKRAPTPDKVKKLMDGGGLFLALLPSGSKVWRQNYRLHGKEQTEVFGPYPLLGLADARVRSAEFKRKLLDGVDVKAKPEKSVTFKEACALYWAGRKDVTEKYITNATNGLTMHLFGAIGNTPVAVLTRQMLLDPLMVVDAQGKHEYSRRVRMWSGLVLEWAKEQGHCSENVVDMINPRTAFGRKVVVGHAALKVSEMHDLFARVALEKDLQSVLALKMMTLTWVRTGELRKMKWEDIDGDLWRLAGASMKMGREHLVPLPTQALVLLEQLKLRCRGSAYVFPGDRRLDRTMSENAVLYLLGRIGYKGLMTGHGLRKVASTWANERNYNADAVEMALAHASGSAVRKVYNHAAYLPQRRQMLQDFADWLKL